MDLIGTGEIERDYGLSRVQVFRLMQAGEWPEAAAELGGGRVWKRTDVAKTVTTLKRQGRLAAVGDRLTLVPRRYLAT